VPPLLEQRAKGGVSNPSVEGRPSIFLPAIIIIIAAPHKLPPGYINQQRRRQ